MQFNIKVKTIYNCNLERTFKTPMLCDVTKIHTGFGLMPKIVSVSDDKTWGKPGGSKKVYAEKSIVQKGGYVSLDKVLERVENHYWKIEVSDFQAWMLGFYKFEGEWQTNKIDDHRTEIVYTYTLFAKGVLYYPFCWMFAHLFWKIYMKKVLKNVWHLVKSAEPYMYP